MVFDVAGTPPDDARILIVCTGNICRSPFAEYSLRANLRSMGALGIHVYSAGTRAVVGRGAADEALHLLAERSINGATFRAQALEPEMITAADLVLTAAAEHRTDVVQMVPRAHSRTFTVRQFARLLPAADPIASGGTARGRIRELVQACAAVRGVAGPSNGSDDDIQDPWGGPVAGYRRMADTLREPLRIIAGAIAWNESPIRSGSHRATSSTA